LQDQRKCLYCGTPIDEDAHRSKKYCNDECRRRMYRLKNNLPTTAHGEHYRFWQVLHTYTLEELQVLFRKRKTECKHASHEQIKKLRKEMKIIGMVYEEMKKL
jgi:hypothetical protein